LLNEVFQLHLVLGWISTSGSLNSSPEHTLPIFVSKHKKAPISRLKLFCFNLEIGAFLRYSIFD